MNEEGDIREMALDWLDYCLDVAIINDPDILNLEPVSRLLNDLESSDLKIILKEISSRADIINPLPNEERVDHVKLTNPNNSKLS